MKNKMVMITMSLCCAVSAQSIDLTGTVTNASGGAPLQGVVVTLKNDSSLIDTTKADGTYQLSGTESVIRSLSSMTEFSGNRFKSGLLEIGVTKQEPVTVETYGLNGVLRARLLHDILAPGLYTLNVRSSSNAADLCLIKVRQGDKTTVYPLLPLGSSFTNNTSMKNQPIGLAKSLAFDDTLVFTKSVFATGEIAVTSPTGVNDIALVPIVADTSACTGTPPAGMKCIKGGTFTMGSSNYSDLGASPPHQVTVSTFFMDSTDITQAQYKAVIGTNPSAFQSGDSSVLRPVESVTWFDAALYCNALSKLSSLDTCYIWTQAGVTVDLTKHGYRLPTEAEWEYACRAGTTTAYYWGDTLDGDYCWNSSNTNSTQPVATRLPNAWGLYDMSGEVWQWCNDWYESYTADTAIDPTGGPSSGSRVVRGGSWRFLNSRQISLLLERSAYRSSDSPYGSNNDIGFRCVRR